MADISAASIVAEMADLGADFTVNKSNGTASWQWEAKPSVMRNAVRNYWDGIAEQPSDEAMVRAILRRKYAAAP